MKTPSRTLINWIALGLIVLFIWILLAAIIAPRLRQTTAGAGDLGGTPTLPGFDATTTALYAPTPTALYWSLPAGALITTEQIDRIPAGTRVQVQNASYTPDGWVYSIATLDRSMAADAREHQLSLDPAFDVNAPTAIPRYADPAYWSQCYPLVLTEDIAVDPPRTDMAAIPAGTRVSISSYTGMPMYVEGHGYTYQYSVIALPVDQSSAGIMDQTYISGFAYEHQLAPSQDVTVVEGAPTPTSPLEFGVYGAAYITTEQIGDIPAGTNVSVGSAYHACDYWVFSITTADGLFAEAREDQIMLDPSFTPGPTPTYPQATATATPMLTPVGDPRFAGISGVYACSGTENGMLAGAGELSIAETGYFTYTDYYPGDPITGYLDWQSDTELTVVEPLNILSMTVIDAKTLNVTIVAGSLTHSDQGYLHCTNLSNQ